MAWSVAVDHVWALLLLWCSIGLTGGTLARWLRPGIGRAGAVLLGVVYWTLALYVLPFAGGLIVAAGIILLLAGLRPLTRFGSPISNRFVRRLMPARLILILGTLPFLSTLLTHYVPHGMDAAMHTTAAVSIARSHGLPANYAPYLPEVPFLAVNLGVPAAAALPILCGADPAAVMLAAHHLTFTCLILATYVLLRRFTRPISAAVLAVSCTWLARAVLASVGWGGFPTVMSIASGTLAARLLLDHGRPHSWRLSLTTGAVIAAIPLVHGIGGGTWAYCVLPWAVLAVLFKSGNRLGSLRRLAVSSCWTLVFLVCYRLCGTLEVGTAEMERTREFVEMNAPAAGPSWRVWLDACVYVSKDSGRLLVVLGLGGCLFLAWRGSWRAALLLMGSWLSIAALVANARWYILPASFLLYPDRVIYWTTPLAALCLALAWRSGCSRALRRWASWPLALALLAAAGYFQNQFYQRTVREDFVDRDGWEALTWARQHLDATCFVSCPTATVLGAYFPPLAQVACTSAHNHHFIEPKVSQAYRRRKATHQLTFLGGTASSTAGGTIVFANRSVAIVVLGR